MDNIYEVSTSLPNERDERFIPCSTLITFQLNFFTMYSYMAISDSTQFTHQKRFTSLDNVQIEKNCIATMRTFFNLERVVSMWTERSIICIEINHWCSGCRSTFFIAPSPSRPILMCFVVDVNVKVCIYVLTVGTT